MPDKRTYTATELAELLGVSSWAIYEAVRRGETPVPAIRVGRRIVFSKAAVDALLGQPQPPEPAPAGQAVLMLGGEPYGKAVVDFGKPARPKGPCALCGADPARGYANLTEGDRVIWLCHGAPYGADKRTCYVRWTVYGERGGGA